MKKTLLLATMFVATVCNAQVILWDGENKEVGTDGGFWNRADPTVVDDNGNKCLKLTLKANPGGWDQEHHNAALPVGDANFKGLRRVTFRMKMAEKHNVMVQLEGKDGAYNAKRICWYDTPNEWQVMVYEYAVGPENEKITDTGSNVLAIWPFEETNQGEGQTIYIDDIKVEGPMVNDMGVRTLADNSLTGDVVVTGTIGKGTYQNTWDGDWHPETYDDFALLAAKLAADAKTLDVSNAAVWEADWDVIKAKCPNIEIRTNTESGISTLLKDLQKKQTADDQIYNLAGQRMGSQPVKGIYIQNGKKVLR